MPVGTDYAPVSYVGNGIAVDFPANFISYEPDEVLLFRETLSTGAVVLVDPSDYNVTGVPNSISVNYEMDGNPVTNAYRLWIVRRTEIEQPLNITNSSGFFPAILTRQLDRIAMIQQEQKLDVDRAFKVNYGQQGGIITAGTEGQFAGFDENGNIVPRAAGPGSGDVTGPVSSIDSHIVLFNGITGKLLKDSGIAIAAVAMLASPALTGIPTAPTAAQSVANTQIATTAFAATKALLLTNDAVNVLDYGAVGNGSTDDSAAFAAAYATGARRIIVPGPNKTYRIDTSPTTVGGSRSVIWDVDPSVSFTGTANAAAGFLYARSNELHRAAGPYWYSYMPTQAHAPGGGISPYMFEMVASDANAARQSATLYAGAVGASPNAGANVWAANFMVAAEGSAAGTYLGLEIDVNVGSGVTTATKGLAISGAGPENATVAIEIHRAGSSVWNTGISIAKSSTAIKIIPETGAAGIIIKSLTAEPAVSGGVALAIRQQADTKDTILLTRETNTSPTGYYLRAVNADNSANVALLDMVGNFTTVGLITSAGLTASQGAADTSITVSANAGQNRNLRFHTGSLDRWRIYADNVAEAGSNAGSDFIIRRYDDAGASLGNAIKITRSNGSVAVTGNISGSGYITGITIANSGAIDPGSVAATFKQRANNVDTLFLQRFTDSSPTGHLIRVVDAANSTNLFRLSSAGNVTVSGLVDAAAIYVSATKVVGTRVTGWAAATGTATRTTFATGSVTTAQLAERVKALIDDLTTHGLIGT